MFSDNIKIGDEVICIKKTDYLTLYNSYIVIDLYWPRIKIIDDGLYINSYPIFYFDTVAEIRSKNIDKILNE